MGFSYEYEFGFPEAMEGAAESAFAGAVGLLAGVLVVFFLFLMAFSVVSYVLNAVGMYRIAKRRGIHHPWLAWIPVGCNWLLGSISDHYQYVTKQKNTSKRKVLLILSLILAVITVVYIGGVVGLIFSMDMSGEMTGAVVSVALIAISYLAMLGLAIAITVLCYIAYYDLFRSCKPKYDVLFLVLGVLFGVTLPFFVFACSSSDEGMPARKKQEPAQQVLMEQPEVVPTETEEEEIPVVEAQVVEDPE